MSEPRVYDPLCIVGVLWECGVQYVLIGATAARLQGFPRLTARANITPATDRPNIERLALALKQLNARIYVAGILNGLPFEVDARTLMRAEIWNLVTDAGRLYVFFRPLGTNGYDDLVRNAVRFHVDDAEISAASIADIIRCKKAADRSQDRADIPVLEALVRRAEKKINAR
ncbi:MAG: hypothetical protein ABI120_19110 [Gemmatimonadaceae bacterium]